MDKERVDLPLNEIPASWYNVLADLPKPLPPPLHPGTGQPLTPDDLAPLFPMALIEQEMSPERWIPIPAEVRELYKIWRPTPLVRATRLEKALKTSCRIYFKNESVSPAGSHKLNTALAQAYYNKVAGRAPPLHRDRRRPVGLRPRVCLPGFRPRVHHLHGEVELSPEALPPLAHAHLGRQGLRLALPAHASPAAPSSPPIPSRRAASASPSPRPWKTPPRTTTPSTPSAACSTTSSCTRRVIGLETKRQLELIGEKPDVLIGCVGGGSNFGGFSLPFLPDKLANPESAHHRGRTLRLPVADQGCLRVRLRRHRQARAARQDVHPRAHLRPGGHSRRRPALSRHRARSSPMLAKLGFIEAKAYTQNAVFEGALQFARTEGFIPAPETSHAIRAAIDEARKDDGKCIVFNYSGHGHFDMSAYDDHLAGKLEDYEHPEEKIAEALQHLPKVG